MQPSISQKLLFFCLGLFLISATIPSGDESKSWIRINLLGYQPQSIKVAVWATKSTTVPTTFELIDKNTGKTVYTSQKIRNA